MDKELIILLSKLMAGLDVPGSMGLIGTAQTPWVELRNRWNLFGYLSAEEIAINITKIENGQKT